MKVDGGMVPGSTTDFGQSEHDAPHFALVAESIFADNLELGVSVEREGQWDSIDIGRDELMLKWSGSNSQTSCLECYIDELANEAHSDDVGVNDCQMQRLMYRSTRDRGRLQAKRRPT